VNTTRLEAFSDGVIAIIITIMVLELKVPHGVGLDAVRPLLPVFLSYLLSFVNVGIYWNNHHHMLQAAKSVSGSVLWANLHLLFWLSLVPFTTGWMGENHFAAMPTAFYGANLMLAAFSFLLMQRAIQATDGPDSTLARAVGPDRKGLISRILYAVAIPAAFLRPWISWVLYVVVAVMWLAPDPRIEKALDDERGQGGTATKRE
jgi:uncharacterized membrane protein